jgi:acetyltransferase AlgX (SGNH hydrolase-like protein)
MKTFGSLVSVATLLVAVFGAPAYDIAHGNWPGKGMWGSGTARDLRSGVTAKRVETRLVAGSQLDELIKPRYNEALYLATGKTGPGVVVGKDNWLFPADRLSEPGQGKRLENEKSVAALGKLTRWLEARGCLVVFELIPRKRTLYPEQLPDDLKDPFVPLFDGLRDAMLAEGLHVPDLRPALTPEDELLFFTNDNHWNAEGCHRAAGVIADYIKEQLPDGKLPGKPMDVVFRTFPPEDFIGYQQRLLGFQKGSWLSNRFTNQYSRVAAVPDPESPKIRRGSREPQPIVVIGTSFSQGPFFSASQYVGHFGRQVEDRSASGYAAGYRAVDFFCELLTGARPVPKVLIWEFPEDFPTREGRYFREPLESILEVIDGAPYTVTPFETRERALQRVSIIKEQDDSLKATCTGPKSTMTWMLTEPIPGDAGAVLKFGFNVPNRGKPLGFVTVEWGTEVVWDQTPLPESSRTRQVLVRRSTKTHPILIPLEMDAGESIRYIRIRPYNSPATFELTRLQIWRR